jgi:predicted TIM-barrel fold metal-dependent hydrolase
MPLARRSLFRARPLTSFKRQLQVARGAMYSCDTHVHVWTTDTKYPTQEAQPLPVALSTCGSHENLLAAMDKTKVHHTLLVQPINYLYDHSYLFAAAREYPDRFSVVALADVSCTPERSRAHVREVVSSGAIGIRINPGLASNSMTSESVSAALQEAGSLEVPAALFVKGLDGVEEVARLHSATSIVLDHFAIPFVNSSRHDAELQRLLDIARRQPNIYVKASAFFRVSDRKYPYEDRHATVVSLVQALGAHRVMFGTDFPFVLEQCSYEETWDILRQHVPLSSSDAAMVAGGTAAALYKLPSG